MARFFSLMSVYMVLFAISSVSSAQDKTEKNPPVKKDYPRTTIGDVSYVVIQSSVTGDDQQWTLIVEATSKQGDQKIHIKNGRAITSDGKTVDIKSPMTSKTVSLPEGVKIQLELKMGALPKALKSVKTVGRLEFFGGPVSGSAFKKNSPSTIPGLPYDRKAKASKPLVFENVSIDRPDQ